MPKEVLYEVDLDQFWRDDELAHRDNCFDPQAPQMALGIRMSDETVFDELGVEGTPWAHTPRELRIELNKRYNDKAERIVGQRLLIEEFMPENAAHPPVKRIGEVFGGQYIWVNDTEWLECPMEHSPRELERLLNRVERLDLREYMLPPNWESEKKRIYETYGLTPPRMHYIRGPVTLATSIYGTEDFIFLCIDEPELCRRFAQVMTNVIIGMAEILDQEAGGPAAGFSFADDNSCLMNLETYENFGLPVLQQVFARFCPDPTDRRFQHSDSAMGHLLPALAKTGLNAVNFGPTVLVDEIRRFLPRACIDGCLAPFAFMRNDIVEIISQVKRDAQMSRENGFGVNFNTAGSINNGSLLTSMRAVMHAIQQYGRY